MREAEGNLEATIQPRESAPADASLKFGWRVLCGLGLGVIGALAFPPHAFPFLFLLALTGLFVLLQDMTPRQAAYIGQAFGTVLAALALRWMWGMFGAAAISLWALIGAFTAVACSLSIWLHRRLPRVAFPALIAFVWVGIEYFRSEPMAWNFAWLGVGYSLVDYSLPCRIASVIGSYGISFLVVLWCAFAATGPRPQIVALRLAPLFLLFAPFPSGPTTPDPAHAFQARLVQADSEDEMSLLQLSRQSTAPAAQLIVWPEYSFVSDPRPDKQPLVPLRPSAQKDPANQARRNALRTKRWDSLRALTQASRSYLLFGAKDEFDPADKDRFRNTAFLLDPQGDLVGQHVKNHTVHFIKDGIAGTDAHVFATPFGKLGVGICFDMDYPDVARRLTTNGAEALIAPSDNPLNWGPVQHAQHKQLFQMRAAECGRWIATTDVAGNTFLVAPTGRITQSVRTTDPTTLDVAVGRITGRNLFLRGGWRFGQFCFLVLVLGLLWALAPAKFRQQAAA